MVRLLILALAAACAWTSVDAAAQVDPITALLERDGFQLLEAGAARQAADAFREALKTAPRSARLHLGAGIAAYLEHRDADAKQSLEHALLFEPGLVDAKRYLGRLLRRQGDLPAAIRVFEGIEGEPGSAETLARWRRELDLHDRMRHTIGDRFTVSFDGPSEEALASRALESLDRAYWRLGDLLGATFPLSPVSVVLYTREQFRDITRAPQWAAGAYDGIIRVPVVGALDRPAELDRVLAHEFAHALVRTLASNHVPTWLNEGIAVVLESGDLGWADQRVQQDGGTIPIERLTGSFARLNGVEAELAYASSALAVRRMLDEAGGYAIANLLRDLGAGVAFDTAFARRMNRSLADFVP